MPAPTKAPVMPRYVPIDPQPGIVRDDTQYRSEGRWWDCDKIRFRNGRPEMIGGWLSNIFGGATLAGKIRLLHRFYSYEFGATYLLAGCSDKMIAAQEFPSTLLSFNHPLDPVPTTATLGSDPFTEAGGVGTSPNLTVNHVNHGYAPGDRVTFSGATGFDGILASALNQAFTIYTVSRDFYVVTQNAGGSFPANGLSGGGGAVTISRTMQASTATGVDVRLWSCTNVRNGVVFCYRGGPLFYWQTVSVPPVYLGNVSSTYPAIGSYPVWSGCDLFGIQANQVPKWAKGLATGKDQSVIAFGCQPLNSESQYTGGMEIRWSDQENLADWDPREDNTAGSLTMVGGTTYVAHTQTKREIIIWTDNSLHSMQWTGIPGFYYRVDRIADNVTIIGPNAAFSRGDFVYWMGPSGFFIYDGSVREIPCSVSRYVFNNLNRTESYKICCGLNPEFNEIWWHYPATGQTENTAYVVYNYEEKVWYYGTLGRSACLREDASQPMWATTSNAIVKHESGYADNTTGTNNAISSYIESGDMDIAEGDSMQHVSELSPDFGFGGTSPTLTYAFKTRDYPMESLVTPTTGTASATVTEGARWKDLSLRARSIVIRVSASTAVGKWFLGKTRIKVQPDGEQ